MVIVPHFADVVRLDFAGIDSVERTLVVECETASFILVLEELLTGQHRLLLSLSFFQHPFFAFDLVYRPVVLDLPGSSDVRILFLFLLLVFNRNKSTFLFLFGC